MPAEQAHPHSDEDGPDWRGSDDSDRSFDAIPLDLYDSLFTDELPSVLT